MTLKTLWLAAALLCFTQANAQRKVKNMDDEKEEQAKKAAQTDKPSLRERILFGGSAGAAFSSGGSYFMLQPIAAYKVTEHFFTGLGVTYNYWSQSVLMGSNRYEYSDHAYGFNLFARHRIAGPVFAHVEYMPMNFTSYNYYGDEKRIWGQAFFVGGGFQQMSDNSGFYMLILYDLLWESYDVTLPNNYVKSYRMSPFDFRVGLFF